MAPGWNVANQLDVFFVEKVWICDVLVGDSGKIWLNTRGYEPLGFGVG